jgi:hypothetical protein
MRSRRAAPHRERRWAQCATQPNSRKVSVRSHCVFGASRRGIAGSITAHWFAMADRGRWWDGRVTAEPLRPTVVETVFYEPDEGAVIAALPGRLWLAPRRRRRVRRICPVLSTRLQLRRGEARVLIVLDVVDDPADALRGDTPTDVVLGIEVVVSPSVGDQLDDELEQLTDDVDAEPTTRET